MEACDLRGLPVPSAELSGSPVKVNSALSAVSAAKKLTLPVNPTTGNMSEYPLVLIRWADAHCGDGGWLVTGDYEDDGECIIESVGFLIPPGEGGKEGHVNLWQTYSGGEGIHPFHIPVAMVRETKLLTNT